MRKHMYAFSMSILLVLQSPRVWNMLRGPGGPKNASSRDRRVQRARGEGLVALQGSDSVLLFDAFRFAAEKHRDHRRKDAHGSPFINHPIETVHLLVRIGGVTDQTTLVAAVLHDTLQDAATTPRQLEERFGAQVRRLVEEVADTPGLSLEARWRRQLMLAKRSSPRARLIHLADKAADLGALPQEWTQADRERYLTWVSEMSSALGGTNAALEAALAQRLRDAWSTPIAPSSQHRATPIPTGVAGDARAQDLQKAMRQLLLRLSRAEESADEAIGLLEEFIASRPVRTARCRMAPGTRNKTAPSQPGRRRAHRFDDPRWRLLAEPGVGSVEFRERDARTVMVSIDNGKVFPLSPTLATLLRILAFAQEPSPDGFPPFQSCADVAVAMRAATGRPSSIHAVVMGISRLRERLASPMLVEVVAKLGVRFRLRR
jgi:GTP diphosphokinase / guanosine-3',5'-bis(diphosphate) 3'-diphosphatase